MFSTISLEAIIQIAHQAGQAMMQVYQGDHQVTLKDDQSPLTLADERSHQVIHSQLQQQFPGIPIISEEGESFDWETRQHWTTCWLIDPLDGTKEFIQQNGEFTVNIALIHQGQPVLGVVYAPATQTTYAAKAGQGAFKNGQPLPRKDANHSEYRIVASRSHLNTATKTFVDQIVTDKPKRFVSVGSSLKLCLVAEGQADIYPRLGPTMEWDTAAAHAIVIEAGQRIQAFVDGHYQPMCYNKASLVNPWFVVSS